MINRPDTFNTPVRNINVRVEAYNGSTLMNVFTKDNYIIDFKIERVGDACGFYGYSIIHKLTLKLIDTDRRFDFPTSYYFKVFIEKARFPDFYVSEVRRDEKTNKVTIHAYDKIERARKLNFTQIQIQPPYDIRHFMKAISNLLEIKMVDCQNFEDESILDVVYPKGANLDENDSVRYILDKLAEVTSSICFIDYDNNLVFKRLLPNSAPVFTIDKEKYFDLDVKENRRLTKIVSITELGDNIGTETTMTGTTQYLRDNPFLNLREDVPALLDNMIKIVGNLTIGQFDCEWQGNPLVELGDCISVITKDNKQITSFLLNDIIKYDGGLVENTEWEYEEDDGVSSNPTSIGALINQTVATVDKQKQEIQLMAKKTDDMNNKVSQVIIDTNQIQQTVSKTQQQQQEQIDGVVGSVQTLEQKVNTKIDAGSVDIKISEALNKGVTSVTTETGFTFNKDGMTVVKSGSDMKTQVDEDGMKVFRNDEEVLTANNQGVNAINLTARQYLIIGQNSRFEDYRDDRTGCFWVGSKGGY